MGMLTCFKQALGPGGKKSPPRQTPERESRPTDGKESNPMLEEKDLQAIAQLMDARISASEERMAQRMDEKLEVQRQSILRDVSAMIDQKLERQKDEILDEAAHRMKVLLDTEVTMRFNLLAEGQEEILRRMPTEEDMELIDSRITTLEIAVKKLNRRVAGLRPAQ